MFELFTRLADWMAYNLFSLEKGTKMADGVMTTPAVMIDGKIVHSGGVPSADTVRSWLK